MTRQLHLLRLVLNSCRIQNSKHLTLDVIVLLSVRAAIVPLLLVHAHTLDLHLAVLGPGWLPGVACYFTS